MIDKTKHYLTLETVFFCLFPLLFSGHLLEEVVAVLISESQMKLAAAAGGAGSNDTNGSTISAAQNVAAMVLNQRKVDEVAPVVDRLYKKAFAKPKSMLDFFKPVAAASGKSGTSGSIDIKIATDQRQSSGNKRPNRRSVASASGGIEKKGKKDPSPVIMLVDDAEEEDPLVPAALPVVNKEEKPPTSAPEARGGGGTLEVLPSKRPGSAESLSEIDIEAIVSMGFTKSQAEGALRMNSFSVERAADYLLNKI